MRNGSVINQTMGNSTIASRARGQQTINKMHQSKNAAMFDLLTQITHAASEMFPWTRRRIGPDAGAWQWRLELRRPSPCANLPLRNGARGPARESERAYGLPKAANAA